MAGKPKWNPDFTPSFTPKEMLELGVFEGKYINNIRGVPEAWKKLSKVQGPDEDPDPNLNHYGIKSRKSLSYWKEKGWIMTDKNGWFEWYIHYFFGRRLGKEDDKQIARWKSFVARHQGQVDANCKLGNKKCRPKQRQGLLQWAWDSTTPFTETQQEKNLRRLSKLSEVSLEEREPASLSW